MEMMKPPLRVLVAGGRVFRNEATDMTHEAQFHQFDCLVVGENISLANLKSTIEIFLEKLFKKKTNIRLRPSFFPFVEPGVEVDMSCFNCDGKGCSTCKNTGFIEILGAGCVHPKVLQSAGLDSNIYSGFAFGAGIDRLAMLKYGIEDVRILYQGDLRLVSQF